MTIFEFSPTDLMIINAGCPRCCIRTYMAWSKRDLRCYRCGWSKKTDKNGGASVSSATGREAMAAGMDVTRTSVDAETVRKRRIANVLAACYFYRHDVPVDLEGDDEFDLLDVLGIEGADRTLGMHLAEIVDSSPQGD